jgi:hypothetical protein
MAVSLAQVVVVVVVTAGVKWARRGVHSSSSSSSSGRTGSSPLGAEGDSAAQPLLPAIAMSDRDAEVGEALRSRHL